MTRDQTIAMDLAQHCYNAIFKHMAVKLKCGKTVDETQIVNRLYIELRIKLNEIQTKETNASTISNR